MSIKEIERRDTWHGIYVTKSDDMGLFIHFTLSLGRWYGICAD